MTRSLTKVGSIHHLKGQSSYLWEQKWNSTQYLQKTYVECICSAQKSFLEYSWDTPWTRSESWTGDLLIADTEDLKMMPPSDIYVKGSNQVDIQTRGDEFVFLCKLGWNLARRKRRGPQARISKTTFRNRRSPRSKSRSWSSSRILVYYGWLQISESRCSKNVILLFRWTIFLDIWNLWCFRDEQKQALPYLEWRPSMIFGTWTAKSHCLNLGSVWHDFALLNKNPHQGHTRVGSRQTDEETGRNRNRKHEARRKSQTCQRAHSLKRHINGLQKNLQLDAARDQRGIYFIPEDDPDDAEVVNDASRKLQIRRASAMPCKVTTPADLNGSSWKRPCGSDWPKMETERLHSPCSIEDHEDIIIEAQKIQTTKRKEKLIGSTSRTEVMFPCRTTTWCTNRCPHRQQWRVQ